jgi:hypothetical protein
VKPRGLTRLPWISGAFCRKSAGSPVCPPSPEPGLLAPSILLLNLWLNAPMLAAVLLAAILLTARVRAGDWPARGPAADGHA